MIFELGGRGESDHEEGLHVDEVGIGEVDAEVDIAVEGACGAE